MTVRSYRDLVVWQKGMAVAASVYRLTRDMPKQEEYRISGQMIRAATSVPANIAEGHGRGTRRDYAQFVSIAKGSLAELETFLLLTMELELAPPAATHAVLDQTEEVGRMLTALRARLSGQAPTTAHAASSLEPNCLVPEFSGAIFSAEWKEALWARYCMEAPARQRRSVERYNIVKRA